MMSSLVNTVLFLALVLTSLCVLAMYRKLKQLDTYHTEYKRIFDQTANALNSAGAAVQMFNNEGREVLETLGARIEEARSVTAELNAATRSARNSDRSATLSTDDRDQPAA
jgi:hypothetical protein